VTVTKSGAKRGHITRNIFATMVSAACVALLPSQALADSSSKNTNSRTQASQLQKSSAAGSARPKVTSTGSPYICMPSVYGRKGRFVLRQPALKHH